jgi:hypothetical protein
MQRGERYVPLGPVSFMPLVAVLWPRRQAERFLAWASVNKPTRADDANAGRWARRMRQPVLCTVPSLVEHDEVTPSVKGGSVNTGSWRRAELLASDALAYDW